jgi:hypothetical protein
VTKIEKLKDKHEYENSRKLARNTPEIHKKTYSFSKMAHAFHDYMVGEKHCNKKFIANV